MKTKICKMCGREFKQHHRERDWSFARRVTCGKQRAIAAGKLSARLPNGLMTLPARIGSPIRITDREQQSLNMALHRLDCERRGLMMDPGRILARQEIWELVAAGKITPIEMIPSWTHDVFNWG
jgi:hypothetical protein